MLLCHDLEKENTIMPLNGLPVCELLKGFERIDENFPLRSTHTQIRGSLYVAPRHIPFRCKLFCPEVPVHLVIFVQW